MRPVPRSRILVDLSVATDAYAGIPHDARLNFSMLARHEDIVVSGLIYPLAHSAPFRLRPWRSDFAGRMAAALHITSHGYHRPTIGHPLLRLTNLVKHTLREGTGAVRARVDPCKIPDWQKAEALWRILFQKTLPSEERERVLAKDFYFANISADQLHGRANYLPFLKPHRLNVADCDAVLFPQPRPFRLPHNVAKIVRYHDAMSLIHPDTVTHWPLSLWEHHFTNLCARDSIFACNSPISRDDLDKVAPGAGERAVVIPTVVPPPLALPSRPPLNDIIARRRSMFAISLEENLSWQIMQMQQALDDKLRGVDKLRYIVSVSTVEPRKNFIGLIAAWERLRASTGQDIKLILVANRGWGMEPTLEAMRPHVLAGDLIQLHKVTGPELQVLYEEAELCAFIPFAEGFGNCPLEALRSGTPVVASDIPIFRWTLGEAGVFADPYNVGKVASAIQSLLDEPQNQDRRSQIKRLAPAALERFSTTTISEQWRSFFVEGLTALSGRLKTRSAKSYHQVAQASPALPTTTRA